MQARAAAMSQTPVKIIHQSDTFFNVQDGRLKLRLLAPDQAQLVYYVRPDSAGPKRSDYLIFETRDPKALMVLLAQALGVRGVVDKTRYLYLVDQTRIHLDDVQKLGQFVELEVMLQEGQTDEVGQKLAATLMDRLEIAPEDLIDGAYIDLLEKQ